MRSCRRPTRYSTPPTVSATAIAPSSPKKPPRSNSGVIPNCGNAHGSENTIDPPTSRASIPSIRQSSSQFMPRSVEPVGHDRGASTKRQRVWEELQLT